MLNPNAPTLIRLDRALERRSIRLLIAVAGAAAFTFWTFQRTDVIPGLLNVLLAVGFLGLYLLFDLFVWRRLRQKYRAAPDQPFESLVYGQGVFGFGLLMWISLSLLAGYHAADPLQLTFGHLETVAFHALRYALLFLPVSLAAGYGWGRCMAFVFGVQPSSKSA